MNGTGNAVSDVTVRRADRADIPAMQRIRLAVRENALSNPGRITEADYVDALDALGRTWVSEANGEIAGFACGYRSGNLWALFVDPGHEGRGHGAALHDAVVDWMWSLGLDRLWLTTAPGTRAERFYLARGWQARGTTTSGDVRLEMLRHGSGSL
jgi:GNAT superfamily N-acetyltransferase